MAAKKDSIRTTKEPEEQKKEELKFSKPQILSAFKYHGKRDLINALIKENKLYTFDEVDSLIEKYMKGKR